MLNASRTPQWGTVFAAGGAKKGLVRRGGNNSRVM